jgi:glycolate dehydrogenase iron-sulfur subunit
MPMSGITELAKRIETLDEKLSACSRCGMCQAVCPLFAQTGKEGDVARGKLALLDGLKEEMFTDPDGVMDRLKRCLLCGSCEATCSCEVNILEIFFKARAILEEFKGLPLAKKVILRKILRNPSTFDKAIKTASKYQNLFIKTANENQNTSCARFFTPIPSMRHFQPLASKPFHESHPFVNTDPGKSGLKVAFFPGCLLDKVYPNVAHAVVKVLDYHGVGVFMPEGQGCCAIPAISSGDVETFTMLVDHNSKLFREQEFDYLVTACATCSFTIKKVWPMMNEASSFENQKQLMQLAEKTIDISEFLVSVLGVSPCETSTKEKGRVTYHDPCHLKKSLGVYKEPRALIQANPSCSFMEMEEPDICCGMGGSFNLSFYGMSSDIGERKRNHIIASKSTTVATSCPACMMQISDVLSKHNDSVSVKHVIELYYDSISG